MEGKISEIIDNQNNSITSPYAKEGETSLENVIGEMLLNKNMTISVAESCTGGLLAARLVNFPGISAVFMEGVVSYSNESKMNRLGVSGETLKKFGAVSHETAAEMAKGICRTSNTRIGLSTTGIAGPAGGSIEKPVGLVYIGLCIDGIVKTREMDFSGSRQKIREITVITVLDWLRRELDKL